MSTAAVRGVVRRLGLDDPPTDAALLTRYARHRDAAAFAELLRRHGPVVLGACRRILADPHAAEDAFQAVFLVLARKAASVRPAGRVGGWLYGVAVRTARKAKVAAARRWRREMSQASRRCEPAGPGCDLERAELRAVIDDELGRLPAKLREPVVLCDLGGKSRSEAAAELGWPEGTVAARLAKARKLLADRLTRRGVALPAAGLGVALASEVAPALARSTLAAADAFARGVASPAVSPTVQTLAEGMIRAMTTGKLKLVLAAVAAGLLAGAGAFWGAAAAGGPQRERPLPAGPAPNQPAAAKPEPTDAATLRDLGGPVVSVAFAPDGRTFAAGARDGTVSVWDAATRRQMLVVHPDPIRAGPAVLAYSPDGKHLAVTRRDGVYVMEAGTGRAAFITTTPTGSRVELLEQKGSNPTAIAFAPDAQPAEGHVVHRLIFGGPTGYFVKSWIEWPQVSTIEFAAAPGAKPPAGRPVPLAVAPDGSRVIVTRYEVQDGKHVLWAWSAGTGKPNELLVGHPEPVVAAAWSRDGKTIATADVEGTVILWDADTFRTRATIKAGAEAHSVAVSPDGKLVAVGVRRPRVLRPEPSDWQAEVDLLDAATGKELRRVGGFSEVPVASLAFSPDGRTLLAAVGGFDARTPKDKGEVRVISLEPTATRPNPQPQPAAAGAWKEKAVLTHHAGPVDSVAFAPDSKWFVSGGADGRVLIWAAATLKPQELGAVVPPGACTAAAVSPDGKLVAATGDKVTGFFDPQKRQTVQMRPNFPGGRAVAFSPDGKWVATSDGSTIGIKNLPPDTGEAGLSRPGQVDPRLPTPVAWSPDSRHLAYVVPSNDPGGNGRVGIMGVTPDTKPGYLDVPVGAVTAVAWSADGKVIASGGADGHVILWDAETHTKLRAVRLAGLDGGSVSALAFSPDGRRLAGAVALKEGKAGRLFADIDTATGERGRDLALGGRPAVRSVAFSPDGRLLVAACGIDRSLLKPLMTPDEMKAAGAVVVWER